VADRRLPAAGQQHGGGRLGPGAEAAERPLGRGPRAPSCARRRRGGGGGGKLVVIGGRTGGQTETLVRPTEVFDGTSWHDDAAIPVAGDHLAAASDGTYVYAVGGRNPNAAANTKALQRFNPATGQWTQLKPLPAADSDLGAAVVGGQLITFGGENLFSVFSTVRSYNLATNAWSTLPSLVQARHGMGVAVIGNTIYAIGGAAKPGHHDSSRTMQDLRFNG
jgi:N-acetylneuraminic acid mutarotase